MGLKGVVCMRALIVYESMFGNTKRVAEAIADGLRRHGEVELFEVGEAPAHPGRDIDLLVLGGPTHGLTLSKPGSRQNAASRTHEGGIISSGIGLREWIDELGPAPQGGDPGIATFDTRVRRPRIPGSAARAAERRLRRRGYRVAAPSLSFWVRGTFGPLYDAELARAQAWGDQLGSSVGSVRLRVPAD